MEQGLRSRIEVMKQDTLKMRRDRPPLLNQLFGIQLLQRQKPSKCRHKSNSVPTVNGVPLPTTVLCLAAVSDAF